MADSKFRPSGNSGIAQAGEWARELAYQLFEVSYQAQAARAMLHEFEGTDASETLTGVSYLLRRVADDCERLSDGVSARTDALPRDLGAAPAAAAAEKPAALYDLPGELGARGKMAWEAAIEIEQCTIAIRELQGRIPTESDRVIPLLLRRVEDLASVIMSCTSADDTLESLRERAGMQEAL